MGRSGLASSAIAVLDVGGVIRAVNRHWLAMGTAEGGALMQARLGTDYIAACRGVTGSVANQGANVAHTVEAVLTMCSETDQVDYSDGDRWFILRVVASTDREGQGCVWSSPTSTSRRARQRNSS